VHGGDGSQPEVFLASGVAGGGERVCGRARRNSLAIPARPARPARPGNPHEIPPLTRLPCHVNVAFYREEPSERHVHRLARPEAAVLAGLERDVRLRPKCRARGWRHREPGVRSRRSSAEPAL